MLLTNATVLSQARVQKLPACETGATSALVSFNVPSTNKGKPATALSNLSKRKAVAETFK